MTDWVDAPDDGPENDSLDGREDEDMIYVSDDDERERDGVHNVFESEDARQAADRNSLARRVAELERDALDWLQFTDDEDAQEVYDRLAELHELLGDAPEDTDD